MDQTFSTIQRGEPAPGWYPDPYRNAELRWWDGARWTDNAAKGGQLGTTSVSYPMPPPIQFPAPLLPEAPERRNKHLAPVATGLAVVAVLAVVAIAVVSRSSQPNRLSAPGSGALGRTTTTVDRRKAECIERTLGEADRLRKAADAAASSFSPTSWAGDNSFVTYGNTVVTIDLSECPNEYRQRFTILASKWLAYGNWIEKHSGMSHTLEGSDRTGRRMLQQEIVSANDQLMEIVRLFQPSLVYTLSFPSS